MIDKHVILDRSCGGPDGRFSFEKPELAQLCHDTKIAWQALGTVNYERKESEKENLVFRRSLYVVKDIKKGEKFTSDNVRSIRPGYGLAPKHYEYIIGKTCSTDVAKGTPLKDKFVQ